MVQPFLVSMETAVKALWSNKRTGQTKDTCKWSSHYILEPKLLWMAQLQSIMAKESYRSLSAPIPYIWKERAIIGLTTCISCPACSVGFQKL